MAPIKGRVAKPEWGCDCRRGTPGRCERRWEKAAKSSEKQRSSAGRC